jgi:serine phosphatase RsbU (regulator of sigma subunit)/Tfp pilus assembly protein PilF
MRHIFEFYRNFNTLVKPQKIILKRFIKTYGPQKSFVLIYFMLNSLKSRLLLRSLCFLFFLSLSPKIFSQEDSLKEVFFSKMADSTRIEAALRLSMIYSSNNPDYCLVIANKGIELAKVSKNNKHVPALIKLKGVAYVNLGEYKKSAEEYFKALKEAEKQKNQKEVAAIYNNLGVNFWYQKDFKNALKYHLQALEFRKVLGIPKEIAKSYNNLGMVEVDMANYKEAMNYYMLALHIKDSLGDVIGIANGNNNLGIVYERMNKLEDAKSAYEKALKIFREEGDKRGELVSLNNIAAIYKNQGNNEIAIEMAKQALSIAIELDDKEDLKTAYEVLAVSSYNNGNYKPAYDYLENYLKINDSLIAENNFKSVQELEKKYNTEKQDQEIKLLQQNNKIKDIEIRESQEQERNLLLVIALAAIIISLSLFAFLKIRKQNIDLEENKQFIELKNAQLELQKKEIVDSINYAKRIQEAMLKEEEHVSMHLPPHFILFKPKDIVSGDFYWALEKDDFLYFAAADCTGHGVPGAFLTLLGTSFLNEINASDKNYTPSQILNQLRDKIVKELSNHGKTRDGMDISLIRINLKTNETIWAGAYNPLWIIKKDTDKFTEIVADKQPVGYSETSKDFKDNAFTLSKGDQVFLFTDGFADQFGGHSGKKFKYRQLKDMLFEVKDLSPSEQKIKLNQTFEDWRGNLEQVDDVLIVGIKI